MISEIKVDVQNKHEQTRTKNIMMKPESNTTYDRLASAMTADSQNPATPKHEDLLMTKPHPLDGVRAFLTELPPEE